tara:strand:- start:27763 stop:28119 length:357 start_codon:yes stop_codon:yes gene_type:complete
MAKNKEAPDLLQIIEHFGEFIRERAEEDEDIRESILPMIEGLEAQLRDSKKFSSDYPSISSLLAFVCTTLEDHNQKLEMLKDAIIEMKEAPVSNPHGLTKEELMAYAAYKNMDKDLLN